MKVQELFESVTSKIIESLEQGALPWSRPWRKTRGVSAAGLPLRHNGQPYSGMNVLLLWEATQANGYKSRSWHTLNQINASGGRVIKGERASTVVMTKLVERQARQDETSQPGDEEGEKAWVRFLRTYSVFNTDQTEGMDPAGQTAATPVTLDEAHQRACEYLEATGAIVRHGGDRACYWPSEDSIQMPPVESFLQQSGYIAVRAHETIHWTGARHRLNRDFSGRFGDESYAREELVAELGAAYVCAQFGLSAEPRPDHASYLESWLKVLRHDKKAIFTAARYAQAAMNHLNELAPGFTGGPGGLCIAPDEQDCFSQDMQQASLID